jgi:hypothetical protein
MTERTANTLRNIGTIILLAAVAAMLMGCIATQVKVPVPVECKETEPDRPIMPTEKLEATATLDSKTQAALAEIERREGYEVKLVTALRACIAPITK